MNQKNTTICTETTSSRTRITHYAPVASTRGERVHIYRYGIDRISEEYRQRLNAERHPLRRAVIRFEWAQFLYAHIGEYSGNRDSLRRYAASLAHNAYMDAKQALLQAEQERIAAQRSLSKLQRRLGFRRSEDGTIKGPTNGLTVTAKREIAEAQHDLRAATNRLNDLRHICPEHIFSLMCVLANEVSR